MVEPNPMRQAVARAIVEVAQEEGGLALTVISNRSDLLADAAIAAARPFILEEIARAAGLANAPLTAALIRSLGDPS